MLSVGDRVPQATVWRAPNEPIPVDGLAADGAFLLLFYLFDWSSTCTNELELLNARTDELLAAGVRAFAISRDSPYTHISWSQVLDLTFPLLSDWNGDAVEAFDVAHEFRGLKDVARRSAFLVDADGTVRGAWRYDASELPDFDELVQAAQAL